MADKSLTDIKIDVIEFARGRTSMHDELATPFFGDFEKQGADLKFTGTLEGFSVPDDISSAYRARNGGRPAVWGVGELIALVLFLGASIGSWAVGKVCDELYANKVRPALKALKDRLSNLWSNEDGTLFQQHTFQFGVWYDVDRVFVLVIAEYNTPKELDVIDDLIPRAHRAAFAWIEKNGVSHPVMVYRIRQGALSDQPSLLDSVPND